MIFTLPRGAVQPSNYGTELTFFLWTCLLLGGMATVLGARHWSHDLLGGALTDPEPALRLIESGQSPG